MTVAPILTRPTPSLTLADQHTEKVLRKRTFQPGGFQRLYRAFDTGNRARVVDDSLDGSLTCRAIGRSAQNRFDAPSFMGEGFRSGNEPGKYMYVWMEQGSSSSGGVPESG